MREIKFRAWNGEKMLRQESLYWSADRFTAGVWDFAETHIVSEEQEVELMQSTGLKDSNNIEIYEGDVLKGIATLGIVKYNADDCAFQIYETDGVCFLNAGNVFSLTLCIVGNIYENPELAE